VVATSHFPVAQQLRRDRYIAFAGVPRALRRHAVDRAQDRRHPPRPPSQPVQRLLRIVYKLTVKD
jgi:hypothetical protein